MTRIATNWNLDRRGPAMVDGLPAGSLPVGLTSRTYCEAHKIAPGGKIMKQAQLIARERGNRLVWIEDLMAAVRADEFNAAEGDAKAKREVLGTVEAESRKIRGGYARSRYAKDREVRAAAAADKAAAAKAKREARKAAKLAAAAEEAAA